MGWSPFRNTGLTHHNPSLSVKGYTLFVQSAGDSAYLLNIAGQVVQRWLFDDFAPSHAQLLPSGSLLVAGTDHETRKRSQATREKEAIDLDPELRLTRLGGGYTTLREYDFDGNLLWTYNNPRMHHDFYHKENGNLLLPLWVELPDELARQVRGGLRSRQKNLLPMIGDELIEINRDGKELARHPVSRLFDPRKDPIQPLENRDEWTHVNSIDLAEDGRLVVSCRNNSRVAIIDLDEQKILWKIGEPEVSSQHHATWMPNGNIQIFDNGMNRPKSLPYSRIIEVDPQTDEIVWQYQARPAQQFYSGHISGAQRLRLGNVLICEGTSGRLFEVTREGEIAWEWITPFVNGTPDGKLFTWIYRAYRYELDHPAVANRTFSPQTYSAFNEMHGLS